MEGKGLHTRGCPVNTCMEDILGDVQLTHAWKERADILGDVQKRAYILGDVQLTHAWKERADILGDVLQLKENSSQDTTYCNYFSN